MTYCSLPSVCASNARYLRPGAHRLDRCQSNSSVVTDICWDSGRFLNLGICFFAAAKQYRRETLLPDLRTIGNLDHIWVKHNLGTSTACARDRLAEVLPKPKYEGYQARSLHLQSVFDPQELDHYLGSNITFRGEDTVTKISARALHELLAD